MQQCKNSLKKQNFFKKKRVVMSSDFNKTYSSLCKNSFNSSELEAQNIILKLKTGFRQIPKTTPSASFQDAGLLDGNLPNRDFKAFVNLVHVAFREASASTCCATKELTGVFLKKKITLHLHKVADNAILDYNKKINNTNEGIFLTPNDFEETTIANMEEIKRFNRLLKLPPFAEYFELPRLENPPGNAKEDFQGDTEDVSTASETENDDHMTDFSSGMEEASTASNIEAYDIRDIYENCLKNLQEKIKKVYALNDELFERTFRQRLDSNVCILFECYLSAK